jgi:hypothetical protein
MKWVANLNDNNEQLAFLVNGEKIWAMHNDPLSKLQTIVIQRIFSKFDFTNELRVLM